MITLLAAFWKPIAIGIAIIALVAAVGFAKHRYDEGKRMEGRAEVQALWDADRARNIKEGQAQEARWKTESEARQKAEQELSDERSKRAAVAAVAARSLPDRVARVVVPRESVRVLNDAIDAGNPGKTTGPAAKPDKAAPAAAEGADSTVGLLTQWGVGCIAAYDDARAMVTGWQDFYHALQAAQPKESP